MFVPQVCLGPLAWIDYRICSGCRGARLCRHRPLDLISLHLASGKSDDVSARCSSPLRAGGLDIYLDKSSSAPATRAGTVNKA